MKLERENVKEKRKSRTMGGSSKPKIERVSKRREHSTVTNTLDKSVAMRNSLNCPLEEHRGHQRPFKELLWWIIGGRIKQ